MMGTIVVKVATTGIKHKVTTAICIVHHDYRIIAIQRNLHILPSTNKAIHKHSKLRRQERIYGQYHCAEGVQSLGGLAR
jgi:hypothetical protein